MKTSMWMPMITVTVLLTACGGGGVEGSNDAPARPPAGAAPDSASASVASMVGWLKQLTGQAPEGEEALDAARFAPPQPDDSEPETLQ